MSEKFSAKRVVMAKRVAKSWVERHATEEYRVKIYPSLDAKTNLPSWLRSFREGRSKFGSVTPFDFSVEESTDHLTIRSRDYDSIKLLNARIEKLGFETTGIW
jgi:hypothetical protein